MVTGVRNNGHDGHDQRALLQAIRMPNQMDSLIKPGEDIKELLMRTNLLDVNEAVFLADAIAFCDEFDCQQDLQTLLNWMAARCSVNELARKELLMGLTGIFAPSVYGLKDQPNTKKSNHPDKRNNNNPND